MTKTKLPALEGETVSAAPFTETLKIALFGQFGSRKTQQIAGLIDLYGPDNVLIISAERGLGTIRSRLTKLDMVIAVSNMDEVRAAWAKAKEWGTPDRFLVIDGMSQVMEWLANQQLSGAEAYYDAKARNQFIPDSLAPYGRYMSDKGNLDTMKVYGRIGRDSENLLSSFIGLNTNLYVNYLEEKIGGSGYEKAPPYAVDVPGKVGLRAVYSSFDFIGRLYYDENGALTAGFDPASRLYMARTREDRSVVEVPKEIHDFELAKFVQLVKGEELKAAAS